MGTNRESLKEAQLAEKPTRSHLALKESRNNACSAASCKYPRNGNGWRTAFGVPKPSQSHQSHRSRQRRAVPRGRYTLSHRYKAAELQMGSGTFKLHSSAVVSCDHRQVN